MFLPQNIQFLLSLVTILAGKLILEQALPAFATAWLRHCTEESIALSTLLPTGSLAKFAPSGWSCDGCMLNNATTVDKCIACGKPHYHASNRCGMVKSS